MPKARAWLQQHTPSRGATANTFIARRPQDEPTHAYNARRPQDEPTHTYNARRQRRRKPSTTTSARAQGKHEDEGTRARPRRGKPQRTSAGKPGKHEGSSALSRQQLTGHPAPLTGAYWPAGRMEFYVARDEVGYGVAKTAEGHADRMDRGPKGSRRTQPCKQGRANTCGTHFGSSDLEVPTRRGQRSKPYA